MGRRTEYAPLPDQAYDARITDLEKPLRPPKPVDANGVLDNFRNRNITNTTPIQLVGNAPAVRALPQNPRRTGLLIQNKDSTASLFVGFGNSADSNSIAIAAGGFLLFDFTTPNSEVYLFATANVQAVLVDITRGF